MRQATPSCTVRPRLLALRNRRRLLPAWIFDGLEAWPLRSTGRLLPAWIFDSTMETTTTATTKPAAARRPRVLFLSNAELGQANVCLAVSHALLEEVDVDVDVHVASFEALRKTAASALPRAHFPRAAGAAT